MDAIVTTVTVCLVTFLMAGCTLAGFIHPKDEADQSPSWLVEDK